MSILWIWAFRLDGSTILEGSRGQKATTKTPTNARKDERKLKEKKVWKKRCFVPKNIPTEVQKRGKKGYKKREEKSEKTGRSSSQLSESGLGGNLLRGRLGLPSWSQKSIFDWFLIDFDPPIWPKSSKLLKNPSFDPSLKPKVPLTMCQSQSLVWLPSRDAAVSAERSQLRKYWISKKQLFLTFRPIFGHLTNCQKISENAIWALKSMELCN